MSSPTSGRTHYSERIRHAAGLGQAGRCRVNIQIGVEQLHATILLPETRSFNYIMDELQPMFGLSAYQRTHTRIFLQTILGETEILVNSRPNYLTERNIDYVGIPTNPSRPASVRKTNRLWFCLMLLFLLTSLASAGFLAAELLVLRPRLVQEARRSAPAGSGTTTTVNTPLLTSLPPGSVTTPLNPPTIALANVSSVSTSGTPVAETKGQPAMQGTAAASRPLPYPTVPIITSTTGLLNIQANQNSTL